MLALALALVMVLSLGVCFTSCGEKSGDETDLAYVKGKGKLVVGITEFEPMDYKDANGNWIGFDADTAAAFAQYIGVDVEFALIEWDSKTFELDAKNIDCVWNGMTLTDEITSAMATSKPYFNNAQVVIVRADVADQYQTAEACKDLRFAVEKGSAGQAAAEANGYTYTEVADQQAALMEVAAGTSDAAVIDFLMAVASVGEGTGYSSLTYTVSLASEEYGVGFRKGSDLADALNEFFVAKAADGTLAQIADKYGIGAYLITDYSK
jgi:polar amino acid transport system substrate-binding protein